MRRVCYQVAMSLDGYIAGPNGESDWIPMDPEMDFEALFARFDTLLMGRRTYEAAGAMGAMPGKATVVVSKTLRPADHPEVRILTDAAKGVTALKAEPGRDIWLWGGGSLFRSLLDLGLIDTVEPAVIPVVLGRGVPFLAPRDARTKLQLTGRRVYEKSGIVLLQYEIERAEARRKASRKAQTASG